MKVLKLVKKFPVAIERGEFWACDHFHKNLAQDALVRIAEINSHFEYMFRSKIEIAFSATLCCFDVQKAGKSASDAAIWSEMEIHGEVETLLCEIDAMLILQSRGEVPDEKTTFLLTNGKSNIFYVMNKSDMILEMIEIIWSDGWRILAQPIRRPNLGSWDEGNRVFSYSYTTP